VAPRYRVEYLDPQFSERFAKLPQSAQRRVLELLGEIAAASSVSWRRWCRMNDEVGQLGRLKDVMEAR
jgi:hypothetical protein